MPNTNIRELALIGARTRILELKREELALTRMFPELHPERTTTTASKVVRRKDKPAGRPNGKPARQRRGGMKKLDRTVYEKAIALRKDGVPILAVAAQLGISKSSVSRASERLAAM